MQFRFDIEANALYVHRNQFKGGCQNDRVDRHGLRKVDVDALGEPLGIEFVSADEFLPFLRRLSTLDHDHEWQALIPGKVRELFVASAA